MGAQICPHCGGSNPAGAAFCQFCGSPVPSSGATPLPTYAPPSLQPYSGAPMAWGGGRPPSGAPRPRSRLLVLVVIIVAVILVIGLASFFLVPPAPSIQVTVIDVESVDNVCGLAGASASGFNASTGDQVALSFNITGANGPTGGTLACTIETVNASTPGFSLLGVSVPLIVPANETVILSFTVQCPSSDYTGSLTLDMT